MALYANDLFGVNCRRPVPARFVEWLDGLTNLCREPFGRSRCCTSLLYECDGGDPAIVWRISQTTSSV
jgi:hypothetical protein